MKNLARRAGPGHDRSGHSGGMAKLFRDNRFVAFLMFVLLFINALTISTGYRS